jgi:hypothetical protein
MLADQLCPHRKRAELNDRSRGRGESPKVRPHIALGSILTNPTASFAPHPSFVHPESDRPRRSFVRAEARTSIRVDHLTTRDLRVESRRFLRLAHLWQRSHAFPIPKPRRTDA